MDKNDATRNLPPGAKTQTTAKGLKVGVPKRKDFFDVLKKAAARTR